MTQPLAVHLRGCEEQAAGHPWTGCHCGCHVERQAWSVVIPGPAPALNSTYKVNYGDKGKRSFYKDSKVSTWQDGTAYIVRGARPSGWQPSRRVRIEISWWTPRPRDCDAGLKACLDAVAVGLGIDDSCFLVTVISNEVDKAAPRTEITVRNES